MPGNRATVPFVIITLLLLCNQVSAYALVFLANHTAHTEQAQGHHGKQPCHMALKTNQTPGLYQVLAFSEPLGGACMDQQTCHCPISCHQSPLVMTPWAFVTRIDTGHPVFMHTNKLFPRSIAPLLRPPIIA